MVRRPSRVQETRDASLPELDVLARSAYSGRSVLVTGAGGSIGSQLVFEMIRLAPLKLAALDRDENAIHELEQELRQRRAPLPVELHIADVRDAGRLGDICLEFGPQIVFHAAAYKDVSLMEAHPFEAVLTNVMGTANLLDVAGGLGIERFVFVSTQGAVNPVGVMGATKRIGELLVCAAAKSGRFRAASARLGNVLGSRCGVVALFQKQIAAGGPVTVTHPEIVRHFVTMRQAMDVLLAAGTEAQSGEIYFSELGRPLHIHDLARQMILLSSPGAEKQIEIEVIGLRPGEKLVEEPRAPFERRTKTRFDGLSFVEPPEVDERRLRSQIARLVQSARNADRNGLFAILCGMGIGFQPALPPSAAKPQAPETLPAAEPLEPLQPPRANGSARLAKGAASGS